MPYLDPKSLVYTNKNNQYVNTVGVPTCLWMSRVIVSTHTLPKGEEKVGKILLLTNSDVLVLVPTNYSR